MPLTSTPELGHAPDNPNPPHLDTSSPSLKDSFRRLAPVHYLIFAHLKELIPVKLLRVSRELKEELIPRVYKHVKIDRHNYDKFITRALVELKQEGEASDNVGVVTHVSEEVLQDYSHISTLSIMDTLAGSQLLKNLREWNYFYANEKWKDPEIVHGFKSIRTLHLSERPIRDLLCLGEDALPWFSDRPARCDFLIELGAALEQDFLCIDWPHNRTEIAKANAGCDWWSQRITEGQRDVGTLLCEAHDAFYSKITLSVIHVHPFQLPVAFLRRTKRPIGKKQISVVYYLELDPDEIISPSIRRILFDLWRHFQIIFDSETQDYNQARSSYNIPRLEGMDGALLSLEEEEGSKDPSTWEEFGKQLKIREEECGCKGGRPCD
ncbi:hypothetical protein IAU59_001184 [Kwoniella sp. CBS 9459]